MARPRETYAIREFYDARLALDAYYAALNSLAWQIKRKQIRSTVEIEAQEIHTTREKLRKAIENLGFTIT